MNLNRDTMAGIGYILIVHATMPLLLAGIRFLDADFGYHPFQLVFIYFSLPLLIVLPMAIIKKWPLRTTKHVPYGLRSLGEFGGFALQFFALQTITLPVQTALSFTVPILAIPIAIILFREKIRYYIPISLAIGFVGVLIVTRPFTETMDIGVFYMLAAALAFAFCVNMIRLTASSGEPPQRIMFYVYFYTTLITAPFALMHWTPIETPHLIYIAMIGVASILAQFFVGKAFQKAPVAIIMPTQFLTLIFVAVMAYFVFGEVLDFWTTVGAAVILSGALFHIYKSSREHDGVDVIVDAAAGGEVIAVIPNEEAEPIDLDKPAL